MLKKSRFAILLALALSTSIFTLPLFSIPGAYGQVVPPVTLLPTASAPPVLPPAPSLNEPELGVFDFKIRDPDIHRSSVYWFPLAGFAVPGLPQFLNNQEGAGAIYSGAAGFGLSVTVFSLMQPNSSGSGSDLNSPNSLGDPQKAITWGLQVYQTAGSVSAYQAFRSTVQQRRERGDFAFLTSDAETADHLFVAPFKVEHFIEPAVFIPFAIIGGGLIWAHNSGPGSSRNLSLSDGIFLTGISYNAGVGEESLFRGYLMMNLRQSWNSDFWSLAATATIFAAAHLSESNPLPLPQLLLGGYLGWLTEHDHWTLSRAVFVHTWWDVIAFVGEFSTGVTDHAVFLPLVNLGF